MSTRTGLPPPRPREEEEAEETGSEGESDEESSKKPQSAKERVAALRAQMDSAKSQNRAAVIDEKKRDKLPKNHSRVAARDEWRAQVENKRREAEEKGSTLEHENDLHTTAEEATRAHPKKKDRGAFGWDVFNSDSLYRAYNKRLQNIPVNLEAYEAEKAKGTDQSGLGVYLSNKEIPKVRIDMMVDEVRQRTEKRKDFSRRRAFCEDEDITYINDRNRKFNKKIKRSFEQFQHVQEIKQNLERGTAL
jgi:pre-mRNA-splicing factor SYF2